MKPLLRFSLPVTVVSAAIIYVYISTVFVFVDRWFGLGSSPGIMNAVVFSAVSIMCIYSYTIAVYTDPGRVPGEFVPDVEDTENPIHEIKRKVKYCNQGIICLYKNFKID